MGTVVTREQLSLDGRPVLLRDAGVQLSAFDMAHELEAPAAAPELDGQLSALELEEAPAAAPLERRHWPCTPGYGATCRYCGKPATDAARADELGVYCSATCAGNDRFHRERSVDPVAAPLERLCVTAQSGSAPEQPHGWISVPDDAEQRRAALLAYLEPLELRNRSRTSGCHVRLRRENGGVVLEAAPHGDGWVTW